MTDSGGLLSVEWADIPGSAAPRPGLHILAGFVQRQEVTIGAL